MVVCSAIFANGQGEKEASASKVYELKLAHIYPSDHPFNIGCQQVAAEVLEKTNGKVKINIFPGAQLGAETSEINSLQSGAIDIAILGSGEVGKRVNDFNIFAAPFIFKDGTDAIETAKNPMFDEIYNKTHEFDFTVVEMLYYGTRELTTNNAVDSPADTKGLKLRVPDVPIYRYMAKYIFGAAPTPMSLSEVYLALQQGVIAGQENPIPTIYAQKFNEVCSYINMTNHMVNIFPVIMADKTREKLPEEYVSIIDDAFANGAITINQMIMDNEKSLLSEMEASGVTVHYPSQRAEFENAAQALVVQCELDGIWSEGLYNKVKTIKK
jgi:tripartite ATP-independent transporter DctP family solute receptor